MWARHRVGIFLQHTASSSPLVRIFGGTDTLIDAVIAFTAAAIAYIAAAIAFGGIHIHVIFLR